MKNNVHETGIPIQHSIMVDYFAAFCPGGLMQPSLTGQAVGDRLSGCIEDK